MENQNISFDSRDQLDQLADNWNKEVKEKAGKELIDFKGAFAEALPDYAKKDGVLKGAFNLYGDVARLLGSAKEGGDVNSQLVEKVLSGVQDPKMKRTVETGLAFLQKLQLDTSVKPMFRDGYLLEAAQDIATNPFKI